MHKETCRCCKGNFPGWEARPRQQYPPARFAVVVLKDRGVEEALKSASITSICSKWWSWGVTEDTACVCLCPAVGTGAITCLPSTPLGPGHGEVLLPPALCHRPRHVCDLHQSLVPAHKPDAAVCVLRSGKTNYILKASVTCCSRYLFGRFMVFTD